MDFLMQAARVSDFGQVLEAYRLAGVDLGDALDGGAGYGTTAKQMLDHLDLHAIVHAYEPFPGNHRFFEGCDPRIHLIQRALADRATEMRLAVSSVVPDDSAWGQRGLSGYSSAGRLAESGAAGTYDVVVECVRADEDAALESRRIGFVKLDLQGGELNALKGMTGFLRADVAVAWVEYGPDMSSFDLLRYLWDQDFLLCDTQYLFRGDPSPAALEVFEVATAGKQLSSGATVWYGFKRTPWTDYATEIERYAREFQLIQTDLCCVNRRYLRPFLAAARFLA